MFLLTILFSSCYSEEVRKKMQEKTWRERIKDVSPASRLSFENGSIRIECPGLYAYYSIDFNDRGRVALSFCREKNTIGKADPLVSLSSFRVSEKDIKHIDSLLLSLQPVKRDSTHAHDTFRYWLTLDGEVKIESNYASSDVYKILKLLTPYFPKDFDSYDFCGFFRLFKDI